LYKARSLDTKAGSVGSRPPNWKIEPLVYELYALTEEEIRIVEGDRGNK
jgi:hypothetical protein